MRNSIKAGLISLLLAAAFGCGSGGDAATRRLTPEPSTGGASAAGGSNTPTGGTSTSGGTGSGGAAGTLADAGTANTAAGGNPMNGTGGVSIIIDGGTVAAGAEQCDGIDNDGNGIIDDLDVGGDGVCDCLKIAVIGRAENWYPSNIFGPWIDSRSTNGAVDLGDQILTADLLRPFQVIVILNVASYAIKGRGGSGGYSHVYSTAESEALNDWVVAGGGLLTTSGHTIEAQGVIDMNALLQAAGVGYDLTMNWSRANGVNDTTGYILNWGKHPTTDGIVKVYTEWGTEPLVQSGLEAMAWDANNLVTLAVGSHGNGRIAMWSDNMILYDPNWVNQADNTEHFLLNLLKWLSPPQECQVPIPMIF